MAVRLPRSQLVLDECRMHLDSTYSRNTSIETYLARSILITLCAELEFSLARLISDRIEATHDEEVRNFAKSLGIVRNARTGEIAQIMARFSQACRNRYEEALLSSIGEAGRGRLGTLVTLRNDFSHVSPPQFTLAEAEQGYADALALLSAVEQALGI